MPNLDTTRQAHQQYLSSGKLSPVLLRDPIFRAWERSHTQGASARRAKAIALEPLEIERLLDDEQEIVLAAKPYMQALSKAAGDDQHAAMLGDARAIVLDVMGDEQSIHGPASVPGPGSLLDEGACGANGIGTPIAEGGYAELVGPEHFIEGFHPFTCQGIPIRNADDGIIGSLSVSVKRPDTARRMHEILICAAHGIEMEILRRRIEDDLRHAASSPDINDEFLEKLRQDVLQALTAARLNVDIAAMNLGRRPEYASKLLQWADRAMDTFHRQGVLWRNVITNRTTNPQNVDLNLLVRDLTMLFETERRLHDISLDTKDTDEPVTVFADPSEIARALFRVFLRALDVARDGGTVNVLIRQTFHEQGEVLFEARPKSEDPMHPTLLAVRRPLSNKLYLEEKKLAIIEEATK